MIIIRSQKMFHTTRNGNSKIRPQLTNKRLRPRRKVAAQPVHSLSRRRACKEDRTIMLWLSCRAQAWCTKSRSTTTLLFCFLIARACSLPPKSDAHHVQSYLEKNRASEHTVHKQQQVSSTELKQDATSKQHQATTGRHRDLHNGDQGKCSRPLLKPARRLPLTAQYHNIVHGCVLTQCSQFHCGVLFILDHRSVLQLGE